MFSDLFNQDCDNAINLLLRLPKMFSIALHIKQSLNASAYNIYIRAGLFTMSPSSFYFHPVDDIYNSVIIASQDIQSGTIHEQTSPSGKFTGQEVEDQGCV